MAYPPFHPKNASPAPLSLSAEEFAAAFPSESEWVERKAGFSAEQVQEVAVAFFNTYGGVILLGVADDGSIVGRELTPALLDDVHRTIRAINDHGRYDVDELRVDGRPVVVIACAERSDGFAQTARGRVMVRRGTTKVPLIGRELAQFINARQTIRFEETECPVGFDAVDHDALARVTQAYGWTADVPERLRDIGLLAPIGDRLTVAGALTLLPDPAKNLGKALVEVLRYPSDSSEYDRRVEFRGPLDVQIELTVREIMREIGIDVVVLGLRRYEMPRLPEVVVREAIANAVAHRSYEMNGTAVRVEIRPRFVRVTSPGDLREPVTLATLRETQAARNPRLISVLRRHGIAEDVGRGIDVIEDSMAAQMLDAPVFTEANQMFIVTLPIVGGVTPRERAWVTEVESRHLIEPRDRILLVHAARGIRMTNSRARGILGADGDTARAALQRLRDAGFLTQHGARGGAHYVIEESLAPPAGLQLGREDLKSLILKIARDTDEKLTNAYVRERTGLDRAVALRLLDELVSEGMLTRLGSRRGTHYVLPDDRA